MVGGRDPALLESMTIVPGTRRDSNEGEEGKANDLRVHKFFRNIFTRMHLASLGEAWWLMPKAGEAGKAGDAMQLLLLTGDEGTCSVPNSSDRPIFVKRRVKDGRFLNKNTGVRRAQRRAKLKFL